MFKVLARCVCAASLSCALAVAGSGAAQASSVGIGGATGLQALQSAYSQTMKAGTARLSLDESVTAVGAHEDITLNGIGMIDGKLLQAKLAIPGVGTSEEIIIGTEMYIQYPPAVEAVLTPGKSWGKADLNRFAKASLGATISQFTSLSQAPNQYLAYLGAVSDRVVTVGPATVHGVATTEYTATVDLAKVAAQRPALKAAVNKLEAESGLTELPIKAWLDGQDRLNQLSLKVSFSAEGIPASVNITSNMWDFGTPLHITAPPASEVADITQELLAAAAKVG